LEKMFQSSFLLFMLLWKTAYYFRGKFLYNFMDLDENTRLLPKIDESKSIFQKNELFLFGIVPDNLREIGLDLNLINKSKIKKICSGNSHCLILFNDGELFGFGENICGQLGLPIQKIGNFISEIKSLKFTLPDKKDIKIIDIACGDLYSLVLVNWKNNNYLVKFGLGQEDIYRDNYENVKTVVRIT
jgi:hypothetical protein